MTRQVVVVSQPAHSHRRRGVGEMTGAAAAECAAVCCCCPCTVLNLVVLAVYTVPKGLFRKAMDKRRRRLISNSKKNEVVLLQRQRSSSTVSTDIPSEEAYFATEPAAAEKLESVALEKEMWARFAGTGFWRSESQRQPYL
ncbi:uncharacterized protein LOC113858964 [Abrus precatorius]|uniref:Uncharacterized protein LOC113858964 n=1 Tax=Abrus precatorius TaxID=3816 RepID=A0A8B8KW57_ABRPR|nr:uncharacterized protein LOC113858964 [Abrus precatorius]